MQRLIAASWLLLALLFRGGCLAQGIGLATTDVARAPGGTMLRSDFSHPAAFWDLNGGFDDLHYGPWRLADDPPPPQEPASPAPPAAPLAQESSAAIPSPAPPPPAEQGIDPQIIEQAKGGDEVAQYKLGYNYYLGRGIAQDYAQAAIWWKKSAEQGYPQAQNNVGVLYNGGKGIPQSYSEAYFWQNLAAARTNGPLQAQFAKNRDESAARLSLWERLRVQKRAAKWAADHPIAARPADKLDGNP